MSGVYMTSDRKYVDALSRNACPMIIPMLLAMDANNEFKKKELTTVLTWHKDYRTWNKIFKELVEKDAVIRLDQKNYMVSPHLGYIEGANHKQLIDKWNNLKLQKS